MRKFVTGDWHGEYNKAKEALKLANFDYNKDVLIHLGDVVDRGPDSYNCIELLLKCNNLIAIKGNHDVEWFKYIKTREKDFMWNQGQIETLASYENINPEIHFDFFSKQIDYYIDNDLNLFVHGGFNRHKFIELQEEPTIFYWDRDLLLAARSYSSMKNMEYPFKIQGCEKGKFKEIFVGHTPVQYFNETKPIKYTNIWDLDTGAGKYPDGFISIMNIDTKEIFQA